jgi:hypothetical protein
VLNIHANIGAELCVMYSFATRTDGLTRAGTGLGTDGQNALFALYDKYF